VGDGTRKRKGIGQVKAREIIFIGALFFAGFVVSEFLIEHMTFDNPLQRFLARVICQAGFYLVIYMMFALSDTQKRLKHMEALRSRERKLRPRNRILRPFPGNGRGRLMSDAKIKGRGIHIR